MLRDLFSLFPAYAGVIPENDAVAFIKKAFPRIRGGDPCGATLSATVRFFSPHTRG